MATAVDPKRYINIQTDPKPKVYTKGQWSDAWVEREHLYCNFMEHAASPTMSSAEFSWHFGWMMRDGKEWEIVEPLSLLRYFIKVEIEVPTTGIDDPESYDTPPALLPITWYGIVVGESQDRTGILEVTEDLENPDTKTRVKGGHQVLSAVGMEWLLTRKVWADTMNSLAGNEDMYRINGHAAFETGITFNGGANGGTNAFSEGRGNRDPQDGESTRFYTKPRGKHEEAVLWNSWHMLYEVTYWWGQRRETFETPINLGFVRGGNEDSESLRSFTPTVRTYMRTYYDILNSIIGNRGITGWHLEVDDYNMSVSVDSFSKSDILIGAYAIKANNNQKTVDFDDSLGLESCKVVRDASVKFDRVVVRGAKRGVCMTVGYKEGLGSTFDILNEGWGELHEDEYADALSGEVGYSATNEEWIKKNDRFRANDKFAAVFTHHQLATGWEGYTEPPASGKLAIPHIDIDTGLPTQQNVNLNFAAMRFSSYLPLKVGWNYYAVPGTNTEPAVTAHIKRTNEFRKMFAVIEVETGVYQYVDRLSAMADKESVGDGGRNWSCTVSPMPHFPGVIVKPSGLPHRMGLGHSSVSGSDTTAELNFRELLATVFFEIDAHCEVQYPTGDLVATTAQQVKTIDIGNAGRLDDLAYGTVVDIDDDGALVVSSGGWLRDDRDWMKAIAQGTYEWYKTERKAIELVYRQITGCFSVGDMITQIGYSTTLEDVNSVVTSVRWDFESLTTTIRTSYYELDSPA